MRLQLCQDSTGGAGGKGSRARGPCLGPSCQEVWETWVPRAANCPPRPVFIKSSIGVWQMSLSLMLPGWEVCFPPPPPLPPSPHCPPIQWQDGETVGHACEWVATRLGGPKQGHPLVMPHGVVLAQPTACSGTLADRAISSLAPSVTF